MILFFFAKNLNKSTNLQWKVRIFMRMQIFIFSQTLQDLSLKKNEPKSNSPSLCKHWVLVKSFGILISRRLRVTLYPLFITPLIVRLQGKDDCQRHAQSSPWTLRCVREHAVSITQTTKMRRWETSVFLKKWATPLLSTDRMKTSKVCQCGSCQWQNVIFWQSTKVF